VRHFQVRHRCEPSRRRRAWQRLRARATRLRAPASRSSATAAGLAKCRNTQQEAAHGPRWWRGGGVRSSLMSSQECRSVVCFKVEGGV
jgi:hypothetical protein